MSCFSEEMKVIPRTARYIAVLAYVATVITVGCVMYPKTRESGFSTPSLAAWVATALLPTLFAAAYVLLLGYVYGDAKRRGMRYCVWTCIAALVPNAIGILLYFLLRDPMMEYCPNCRRGVRHGLAFCPYCGHTLSPACPNCKRGVELGWSNCAYCGAKLGMTS